MITEPGTIHRHDRIGGSEFALFAAILTASMAVRLWHLSWGLPDLFEEAAPFTVARRFWGPPGGPFTILPEFYHYPALSFYVHFLVQAVQYAAGALSGEWQTLDAFRVAMAADPGTFQTGARLASALFDTGTVGLAWLIARDHFGRGIAVGAALLAAFNPLQVEYAQGVNVDVLLAFFLALSLRKSLQLSGHSGARDFLVAGALVGLAASTKYTGALFLAVPAFVIGADFISGTAKTLRFALREAGLALLVPAAAAAVFAALNPGIFIDPSGFLRDFTYEQHHMAYGHLGLDAERGSASFYLAVVIVGRLGLPFLAGAVAGIVVSGAGKNIGGIAISAMAAIYIAVISTWEMHAERYLLPAVPLLSILCSAGCVGGMRWAAGRAAETIRPGRARRLLVGTLTAAAVAGALAVPVVGSLGVVHDLGKTDTRTLAREWITSNVGPGSIVVSGPFGVTIPPRTASVVSIPFVATGSEAVGPFYDVRWYEEFDLLIASDYDLGRYRREPERFARMLRFERDLASDWRLLAEFIPDDDRRGPAIRLYAPGGRAADSLAPDLLRDLATVGDADLVAQFARNLSGALYSRGKTGKCEQLIDLGLRIDPADPALLRTRAFLLYKEKRYAEALDAVDRAIGTEGERFELLVLKGNILSESGRPDAAGGPLLAARDLRPTSPLPYTLLIGVYSMTGDTAALAGTLERYLAVIPAGSQEALRASAWLDSLKRAR